jgi:hypothetical protein
LIGVPPELVVYHLYTSLVPAPLALQATLPVTPHIKVGITLPVAVPGIAFTVIVTAIRLPSQVVIVLKIETYNVVVALTELGGVMGEPPDDTLYQRYT